MDTDTVFEERLEPAEATPRVAEDVVSWMALVCRVALGVVFLYAGLPKLMAPQAFLIAVRGYMMLPDPVIPLFTIALPAVEVVVGAALVAGVWPRAAALVTAGMVVMFLVAIAQAMVRGIDIECGCFAHGDARVGWGLVFRDILMLAMLVPVFLDRRPRWAAWPAGVGGPGGVSESS